MCILSRLPQVQGRQISTPSLRWHHQLDSRKSMSETSTFIVKQRGAHYCKKDSLNALLANAAYVANDTGGVKCSPWHVARCAFGVALGLLLCLCLDTR